MRTRCASAMRVLVSFFFISLLTGVCPASGGSISGQVIRELDGKAIPEVSIRFYDTNWKLVAATSCDHSGRYSLDRLPNGEPLPAGRYFLQTSNDQDYIDQYYDNAKARSSATAVDVRAGEKTENIDFSLDFWSSISGRVTSDPDKTALSGIQIKVFNKAWTWLHSAHTDSEGNYIARGLKPGIYYLATWNNRGYLDESYDDIRIAGSPWPSEGAKAIVVTRNSRVCDVDFSLNPGGTISGRTMRNSDGSPLKNVTLTVLKEDREPHGRVLSDKNGNYAILGLPPGKFYLKTTNDQGYVDVHYRNAVRETDSEPIEIELGARKDVDFRLAFGGSISGRITGVPQGEEGLEGVEIRVYDAQWGLVKSRVSDHAGSFSIGGLPTGAYYLRTLSTDDYIDKCFDNVTDPSKASAVQVVQGANAPDINFSLALGGSISGRVTAGTQGGGLEDVYVNVYDTEGKYAGGAPTNLSGRYSVRKIPPGSYYVQTSNALGYGDRYYNDSDTRAGAAAVNVSSGVAIREINFALTQ